MLCQEYRKESGGHDEQVSYALPLHIICADGLNRLLEIYAVLESVNTVKDSDSERYAFLVKEYERLVKVVNDDHVSAAETTIQDPYIRAALIRDIIAECHELLEYRLAAERWHLEIDSAAKDFLIGFGEKLSCRFLAALLEDRVSRHSIF